MILSAYRNYRLHFAHAKSTQSTLNAAWINRQKFATYFRQFDFGKELTV